MTDVVHQEGSPRKPEKAKPKKPAPRAQRQSEPVQQDEPVLIKYGSATIGKGKRLAAMLKQGDAAEMELGELADRLQPKYGEKTLARFAQAIDLPLDRLNRCRSVYRSWKRNRDSGRRP